MKKKIKAIIFDADGVMIKSSLKFNEIYQKEFNISSEVMKPFFNGPFQLCSIGQADLKEELGKVLSDWRWKGTSDELLRYWFKVCDDVDEKMVKVIENLRERGIKCYVATNQEKYRTQYMKEEMNFGKIFDKIYPSCEIGHKKPSAEFFRAVTNDLKEKEGVSPQEIIFWDDEKENVEVAKKFGWQAFLYEDFEKFQKNISQI